MRRGLIIPGDWSDGLERQGSNPWSTTKIIDILHNPVYNKLLNGAYMKPRVLSRGPEVDIEKCVRNSGTGRFDMVLIACARAREIKRQNKSSERYEHRHTIVSALKDIEAGTVDPLTYFAKVPK